MNIALIGYGKMGKAIEAIAVSNNDSIVLKINSDNRDELTADNLRKADVAIEFSNPQSALKNIFACIDAAIPVVSGTTGWLTQWDQMARYCNEKNGTVLYSSNFSIGVNIFFEINKKLAQLMARQSNY